MADQSNGNIHTNSKIQFLINIVRDTLDLNDESKYFPPAIVPCIIEDFDGDIGNVENPRICLSFLTTTLKTLISTNMNDNQEIDNMIENLNKDLLMGKLNYYNQCEEYLSVFDTRKEFVTPHGKIVHEFDLEVNGKMLHFLMMFSEFDGDNAEEFKEFHRRMETFALLFIDGAVRITVDPRWCCFTLYEAETSPLVRYNFIGYSTVYKFHSFPDKIRPRISQFFIIPPFQRCGIGKRLLRAVQNYLISTFNILEITVEDPCEAFCEMRDIVDAERVLTYKPSLMSLIIDDSDASSKATVTNILQKSLFIPTKRVHHMYEIVKLYCILKFDPTQIEKFQKLIESHIKKQNLDNANIFSSKQQRRRGLQSYEKIQFHVPLSDNDITSQARDLYKKYENIVGKLMSSELEWKIT